MARRRSFNIFFSLSFSFVIFSAFLEANARASPVPQDAGSFQKPHFQVEHKAGILTIKATKDKADVDVKSDTIRLLVKPGDREYPLAKVPEEKIVHVESNLPRIYTW